MVEEILEKTACFNGVGKENENGREGRKKATRERRVREEREICVFVKERDMYRDLGESLSSIRWLPRGFT